MKHFFQAVIMAHVEISDNDFDFILKSCRNHYDFTVKSSVVVGGFLYGFNNRRQFSKGEDKTLDLTSRQLGLIIKSLEMQHNDQGSRIGGYLWKVVNEMQDVFKKTNEQLLTNQL